MKILVTGANGQLGHDVKNVLNCRGHVVCAPTRSEMDITDHVAVDRYFDRIQPDAVIHCAAYTAVDRAEEEEALCRKINVDGTRNLTENCARCGIPEMYISTDYVFDGSGDTPWEVDDPTHPVNVYGTSKRDGEEVVSGLEKHFIIRTSWIFGRHGNNFVEGMIRLSGSNDTVRVVNDQFGSPTYSEDLAALLADMIVTDRYGLYQAHNEGFCTWAEFAEEIFRALNAPVSVVHIPSECYSSVARRPRNGRMSTKSITESGFSPLPHWKDALYRYVSVRGIKNSK